MESYRTRFVQYAWAFLTSGEFGSSESLDFGEEVNDLLVFRKKSLA